MEEIRGDEEQWLLDGDCSLCRRNDYCSKSCQRAAQRDRQETTDYINNLLGDAIKNLRDDFN